MALIHVDWNPGTKKIREFGLILLGLSVVMAALGHRTSAPAAAFLGILSATLPGSAGLWIYKAWMGVAFVIGSILSPILLATIYFGLFTPLALIMKLIGRDALRLKRPATDTYWTPMNMPDDKSYYERLF
ncbi:MAG: hypothetical protein HY923_08260 [Elusimicrobia bacterium]|nr:hypothetical protein [Elusimicrobiota bacterium]